MVDMNIEVMNFMIAKFMKKLHIARISPSINLTSLKLKFPGDFTTLTTEDLPVHLIGVHLYLFRPFEWNEILGRYVYWYEPECTFSEQTATIDFAVGNRNFEELCEIPKANPAQLEDLTWKVMLSNKKMYYIDFKNFSVPNSFTAPMFIDPIGNPTAITSGRSIDFKARRVSGPNTFDLFIIVYYYRGDSKYGRQFNE